MYFNDLEKLTEIATPFHHAAPLLQQSPQHEKGAPLARGALPPKNWD
jgi:hypothetical protein